MKQRSLTRRHFVAGSAAIGAAAACGLSPLQALAEGGDIGADARPEWDTVHTICQACPNACGFTAYTVDGVLGKTLGDANNPNAAGNLCARGYGYTQSVYSDAKLRNPMRRKANGEFKTISWDEAFSEIGERIADLVEADGANSIALIYDGACPNAKNYSNLFMNALGSGNAYVDDLTVDVVKAGALAQAIGVDSYYADVDNADAILLVDASLADITTPDLVAGLQQARERGAQIIALDPRLATLGAFASDWYAANPGTELAVLLAVCRQIINWNRYDAAYARANIADFDAVAEALQAYTPAWAQQVSGIEGFRIEELASNLIDAAPKVAIEYGNGAIAGTAYANSAQTAKVICLLNALLGSWGTPGGALLPFDYNAVFSGLGLTMLPGDENVEVGGGLHAANLIAPNGVGAAIALDYAERSQIKGLITVNADVAYDYTPVADMAAAAKNLELFVCITDEVTQTAQEADYLLPLSSYLTVETLPQCLQGSFAGMAMASPVVAPVDGDNSLPLPAIFDGIGSACGLDALVSLPVMEASLARLAEFGLEEDALAQNGSAEIEPSLIGRITAWPTSSGKIEVADADAPLWVAPVNASTIEEVISDDMDLGQADAVSLILEAGDVPTFHLITGTQSVIGMRGYDTAELTDIAEMYQLDSAWINSSIAELYGISTGDRVVLHNDRYSAEVQAYVTGRIAPTAIYLPLSFGRTNPRQRNANGVGANALGFSDEVLNPDGALCIQEACVGIKFEKEGA